MNLLRIVTTAILLFSSFDSSISFVINPAACTLTSQSSVSESANRLSLLQLSAARKSKKTENAIPGDTEDKAQAAKRAALDVVLTHIEKTHGRGSVVKLGDADHMRVESISTGALTLDAALGGGGYPKGRVVEIYGPESSGKTTLALHAIAESQRNGGQAAFIDAEHALDPAYAASLGVDVDNLLVCQPDSGEMALDVVDQLVRSAAVDVVVVDSVAALVPRAELEGDMSDMQIGLQARLMSKAMRKITGSLAASQCCVIFINQLRSKVGVIYGSPEVTSGGNALKFYSSVRLDIRRKEILADNLGIRVKVKVVKNKIAAPFKAVMLDILFGSGIDTIGCMVDAAVDLDIIERRGSWYAYQGQNVVQGRQNLINLLKSGGKMYEDLQNDVRVALDEFGADNSEQSIESPNLLEETSDEDKAGALDSNMESFL